MTFTLGREESLQRAQLAAQETGTRPLVGDKLETLLGATPQHLQLVGEAHRHSPCP